MRLPSSCSITLPFGATTDPYSPDYPHKGTDFAFIPDKKIYAPFAGKVILRPDNGRDGNGVYMYNGQQFHGLLHTSKYLVNDGDQVAEGQPIAIMGDTGFTQGVHLHWCVKLDNQFIDPMSLFEGYSANHLQKGETMVDEDHVQAMYRWAAFRQGTDDEVKSAVGNVTYQNFIENLDERTTSDERIQKIREWGPRAVDENWPQQMQDMIDAIKRLSTTTNQDQIDVLVKQADDLEQSIKKLKG